MSEQPKNDRMIHIRLPKDLHRQVRYRCINEEESVQRYVLGLIERDMKKYGHLGGIKDKRRN